MELLIPKISDNHCDACHYEGVVAYSKAADDQTYVLKAQKTWFIIYEAQQSELHEIFKYDDETGDGLIFNCYDEAIQGFKEFLNNISFT